MRSNRAHTRVHRGCSCCISDHRHRTGRPDTGAAGRSAAAGRGDPKAADPRTRRQKEIRREEEAGARPPPQPPAAVAAPDPETINPNSVYGAAGSVGAASAPTRAPLTPVNPTQLIPTNLQGFSSSATNVTPQQLDERQPRNLNEALTRVPGVIVINDDGAGHHGGIGMRGSPPRRSRKLLIMEDGHTVNLALWLDPSVHYWAPDRARRKPRGHPRHHHHARSQQQLRRHQRARTCRRSVRMRRSISSAIGFTELQGRLLSRRQTVKDASSPAAKSLSLARAHAPVTPTTSASCCRTRAPTCKAPGTPSACASTTSTAHSAGRASMTISSSPSPTPASATTTTSRTFSANSRAEFATGQAERGRSQRHSARCRVPPSGSSRAGPLQDAASRPAPCLNTYNGDVWRGQIVHNAYLDDDTTVTSRVYAGSIVATAIRSSLDARVRSRWLAGEAPVAGRRRCRTRDIYFGEDTMFGRLRTFRHLGGEVRTEWANRNAARRSTRISRSASATNTRT